MEERAVGNGLCVLHVTPQGPRDAVQRFFFCRVAFGEIVPMASSGGVAFGRLYVNDTPRYFTKVGPVCRTFWDDRSILHLELDVLTH